jgi:hypothetical protein
MFQRLLIRRDKPNCVDRDSRSQRGPAVLVRGRLQRRGFGAGEADAERRSLLCFAFCKDSFAILGAF